MKPVFLYPALCSYADLFSNGYLYLISKVMQIKGVLIIVPVIFCGLLLAYCMDLIALIVTLNK
jgi:hypothetical protein